MEGVQLMQPTESIQAYTMHETTQMPNGNQAIVNGGLTVHQHEEENKHDVTDENIVVMTKHSPKDELRAQLLRQLEYYFSSENLAQDTYLMSQMDSQQYVPIWTIANFNGVKKLSTDIDLITDVLDSSSVVQLDELREKVRPVQFRRYVLILREIPENTPVEEVEGLFSDPECPEFTEVEFAASTCWYVSFNSESDAQSAYRHLREKVRVFKGKPIMARIKLRHHIGSFSSQSSHHSNSTPSVSSQSRDQQPVEYVNLSSPLNNNSVFLPTSPQEPYPPTPAQHPPFIAAIAMPPQIPVPVSQQQTVPISTPNNSIPAGQPVSLMMSQSNTQQWHRNIYPAEPLMPSTYNGGHYFIAPQAQQRPLYVQNTTGVYQSNIQPVHLQAVHQNDVHNSRNEQNNEQGTIHTSESSPRYLPAVPMKGRNMPTQIMEIVSVPPPHSNLYRQPYINRIYNGHPKHMQNGDMNHTDYNGNVRQSHESLSPRFQNLNKRNGDMQSSHPQRYSTSRNNHYSNNRSNQYEKSSKYYQRSDSHDGSSGSYNVSDFNNNNSAGPQRRYNEAPKPPTLGETARFSSSSQRQRRNRRNETSRQNSQQQQQPQQQQPQQQQQQPSQTQQPARPPSNPAAPSTDENISFTLENNSFPPLPTSTVNSTVELHDSEQYEEENERKLLQDDEPFKTTMQVECVQQNGFPEVPSNQNTTSNHMIHPEPIIKHTGDMFVVYDYQDPPPVVMPTNTNLSFVSSNEASCPDNSLDMEKLTFVNEDVNHDNPSSPPACVMTNGHSPVDGNSETGSDYDSDKKPTYAEMLRKANSLRNAKQQSESLSSNSSESGDKNTCDANKSTHVEQNSDEARSDDNDSDKQQWEKVNSSKRNHHNKQDENQNYTGNGNEDVKQQNWNKPRRGGFGYGGGRGRRGRGFYGRNRFGFNNNNSPKYQNYSDYDRSSATPTYNNNQNEWVNRRR